MGGVLQQCTPRPYPFTKFSTQKTALSQTHLDGSRTKKTLSERVHKDVTGIEMHRDIFSAYLSRFVNEENTLSLQNAASQYSGMEPSLLEAWERFKQTANQLGASERRQTHSPLERFSNEVKTTQPDTSVGRKAEG